MSVPFTATQQQRLHELGVPTASLEATHTSAKARDTAFKRIETETTAAGRASLQELRSGVRTPRLRRLEAALRAALTGAGLVEVVTPHIISAEALRKMGIEPGDPLAEQVFWIESDRCLRPMLAPNLYTVLRRLARLWSRPFGIFEVGACFRRDTKGSSHLNEFTMLNLVELGGALNERRARLEELAALVMAASDLRDYELIDKDSEIYGDSVDVTVAGLEVCSAAMGPHPLDDAWGISEAWVGLGFGLERLLLAREGRATIERVGRSTSYLDGVRLNL